MCCKRCNCSKCRLDPQIAPTRLDKNTDTFRDLLMFLITSLLPYSTWVSDIKENAPHLVHRISSYVRNDSSVAGGWAVLPGKPATSLRQRLDLE